VNMPLSYIALLVTTASYNIVVGLTVITSNACL